MSFSPLPTDPKTILATKATGYVFDKSTQAIEKVVLNKIQVNQLSRSSDEAKRAEYEQRKAVQEAVQNVAKHSAIPDSPPRLKKPSPIQEEAAALARARKVDNLAHQADYFAQQVKKEQEASKKRAEAATAAAKKYRESQEGSWWKFW